jgi:hypothetical protein
MGSTDHVGGLVGAVAAVLREHAYHWSTGRCFCGMGGQVDGGVSAEDWRQHVAGLIQAALGLREEWTWSWPNGSAPGVPGFGFSVDTREEAEMEGSNIVSRYVSPWVSVVRGATQ